MKNDFYRFLAVFIFLSFTTTSAIAVAFSTNINFNEAAFPTSTTVITGTTDYNVLDDMTGAELLVLNGDLPDFSVAVSSTGGGSFDYRTTNSGSFRASHSFVGSPSSNNQGTRITNVIELEFADHLSVTDFSFDASSTNTRGTSWEVTVFEILDVNGNPFSAAPTIDPYLDHTEINGFASLGIYVLDSRGTVIGVGTDNVSSGSSNPNENFSQTGDLEYSDFGIAAGTQIGGLRMTTFLEDTRGVLDGNSNFTSSLIDFTFSGEIIPEPSLISLLGLGFLILLQRKKT